MDETTLLPILEILKANPTIQYIIAVLVSLIAGVYVLQLIKGLFPDKKKEDKPAQIVIVNADEDTISSYRRAMALRAKIARSQRKALERIVDDIKREKSLDDTIPLRDELLEQLDDIIDEIEQDELGE